LVHILQADISYHVQFQLHTIIFLVLHVQYVLVEVFICLAAVQLGYFGFILLALQFTLIHQSDQLQLQVYVFHQPLSTTLVAFHEVHKFVGIDVKFNQLSDQQIQSIGTTTDDKRVLLFNKVVFAKFTKSTLEVVFNILAILLLVASIVQVYAFCICFIAFIFCIFVELFVILHVYTEKLTTNHHVFVAV